MPAFSLGEPEFIRTSQLREYCINGRNLIRPLANELFIAREELFAVLKELPAGGVNKFERARNARNVTRHLSTGGRSIEVACASMLRTFASFERTYLGGESLRPKRNFDLGS
ncbi:hypothetical protein [Amycolatopsis sp. NBC_01286]|uniref:hypothetical protein n=1 Tax=Amycolatopsis sp. NBC_01286 TaxID=2903560 RepID=UPI002E1622C5|nr:hypothetical protein OG570_48145 [Amycolatopsis sp. NBC_01286]